MNALLDSAKRWLHATATLSWKGALFALVVGLVVLLLRKRLSPAWRHGLWVLVLLRFVLPDVGTSGWSMNRLTQQPGLAAAEVMPMPEPINAEFVAAELESFPLPTDSVTLPVSIPTSSTLPKWSKMKILTCCWLAGIAVVLATMAILHGRLLWRLRRNACEPSARLSSALQTASALAGLRRTPHLIVSDAVRAPALFGVLRPAILLPGDLAATHDTASLRLILLHEIAHLQRRDLWAQVLSSLIVAVHWFNPVAWWAARKMRAEAEMAADARALRSTDASEAHRLGEVLLGFANHAAKGWMVWFATATLLGISENKRDLRYRIEALTDIARGRRTRWLAGLAAFGALALFGLTKAPAKSEAPVPSTETANDHADSPNMVSVFGIVVDSAGQPVKDANVRLSVSLVNSFGPQDVKSGADGRFQFQPVPKAAHLNVNAKHPDFAHSPVVNFKGYSPNEERRLVLPNIPWVTGKITDKRNGRPIKNARVFYGLERNPAYQSRYQWIYPTVRTTDAGEFRLPIAERNAGNIIIRAWFPGMVSHSAPLKISGRETAYHAQLEPAEKTAGQVHDIGGRPVADAFVWVAEDQVTLNEIEHPLTMDFLKSNQRSRMSEAKVQWLQDYSSADGRFELESVDPMLKEHFWVVAVHPEHGFAKMRAVDFKPGSILKLEAWAVLKGLLLDHTGKPLADTTATLHARSHKDFVNPPTNLLRATQNQQIKTTSDGHFEIGRLLPGSTFTAVTIAREYRPIEPVTVSSGFQPERRIRITESQVQTDKKFLRSVQGRIVLPEGRSFRSEDYFVLLFISSNSRLTRISSPQPDADGRFMTESLPPGSYELKVNIHSRNPKVRAPDDSGRWLQFELEPDEAQAPFNVGEIKLDKEDFDFKPASTSPAAVKMELDLDIPVSMPAVAWSASGFGGAFVDREPLQKGRIVGQISALPERPYLLQVINAEGAVFYSQPLIAPKEAGPPLQTPLEWYPGVAIDGKIDGLSARQEGTGWVTAQVTVKPKATFNQTFKGHPPGIMWDCWAPVAKDGSFHFSGLPRGQVIFGGMGQGWVSKFSFRNGDHYTFLDGSEPRRTLTLESQPCLEKQVRLLLPDGKPASNARLRASFFGTSNIHLIAATKTKMHHEESETFATFQAEGWHGRTAVADAEGRVTLVNQPPGETTFEVIWTDPQSGEERKQRVKIQTDAGGTQDVTLAGK